MSQICRVAKKKCNRHYCWEKMRRAEIDLEKVRYVCEAKLEIKVFVCWET